MHYYDFSAYRFKDQDPRAIPFSVFSLTAGDENVFTSSDELQQPDRPRADAAACPVQMVASVSDQRGPALSIRRQAVIYWTRYIGDYARDTMSFGPLEVGIYDLLLDHYYAHERALPLDMEALRKIARCRYGRQIENLKCVLSACFKETVSGYVHTRADEEIRKYQSKRSKAQKAARARWNNADASDEAMQTHSAGTSSTHAISASAPVNSIKTLRSSKPQQSRARIRAHEGQQAPPPSAAGSLPAVSDVIDAAGAGRLAGALRQAGFAVTPANPKLRAAAMHGVNEVTLALAIPHAIAEKQAEGSKPSTPFVLAVAERMHAQGLDAPDAPANVQPLHAANGLRYPLTPAQKRDAEAQRVHEGLCKELDADATSDEHFTIDMPAHEVRHDRPKLRHS